MRQHKLARYENELGFCPQPAVRWLSPPELVRTGLKTLAAHVFLGFLDNRETQSIFEQHLMDLDDFPSGPDGRWVDFIADLGDGFDATYTLAWALAQQELEVHHSKDSTATTKLPKSQLLIMGGDEVYPAASARAYEDRTVRPYRAACTSGDPAALLALPGNHDWYDGLTAFERIFCQHSHIGGWQTLQSRGYFAARLSTHDVAGQQQSWWLLALDSELGSYIDRPQLEYFRDHVTSQLSQGDAVILCTSSPTWEATARRGDADPNANNALRYFEKHYIRNYTDPGTGLTRPTGAQIRVRLSGDKHHYARYVERNGQCTAKDPRNEQLITCGLGGAFLAGASELAPELLLPPAGSREMVNPSERRRYSLAPTVFPSAALENTLRWRLLNPFNKHFLAWRNPWFAVSLGVVHAVLLVFLCTIFAGVTGLSYPRALGSGDLFHAVCVAVFLLLSPLSVILLRSNTRLPSRTSQPGLAPAAKSRDLVQPLIMAYVQLTLASGLFIGLIIVPWDEEFNAGWIIVAAALAITGLLGASLGTVFFAVHLCFAPPGTVGSMRMTALAYEDGKGFLRMHLRADGSLVIYPLIADRVIHDWDTAPSTINQMRPIPAGAAPSLRLLEDPIVVSINGHSTSGGAS